MAPDDPSIELAAMTWEDAAETFESADFIALACGATEQHGRHLPLAVDTIRADELTKELALAAPTHDLEIAVLPALDYGYSETHLPFAGTVTLLPDTYRRVIEEIGRSLAAHDAARFLLVNGHGGNQASLEHAADRLQRDHELRTHVVNWSGVASDLLDDLFGDDWGHSGSHETSMIEYYAPELVHQDRKEAPRLKPPLSTRAPTYMDGKTEQGNTADPRRSDPDGIVAVIEETTDRILSMLAEDIAAEDAS